jgi:hypothetical protein
LTIAIATGLLGPASSTAIDVPVGGSGGKRKRKRLRRVLIAVGSSLFAIIASIAAWIGISIYKIDHAVHHVVVPASLLAKGKNDLLAIVRGPDHFEQVFVFHQTASHTNVLKIPSSLALPLVGGHKAAIEALSLHKPDAIISGLDRLGIPVTHYVGVDLHMVDPNSNLGKLATGKLSVSSLISNPTGTTTLLEQVASHIYLGPGTPVSAVLSLMHVPTAHPVSVPTSKDDHGTVVLASAFPTVLRSFL